MSRIFRVAVGLCTYPAAAPYGAYAGAVCRVGVVFEALIDGPCPREVAVKMLASLLAGPYYGCQQKVPWPHGCHERALCALVRPLCAQCCPHLVRPVLSAPCAPTAVPPCAPTGSFMRPLACLALCAPLCARLVGPLCAQGRPRLVRPGLSAPCAPTDGASPHPAQARQFLSKPI